jgi:phosphohistidine swiveling domain-containing protein
MAKVGFSMEAGFIADFARGLVLEKKWRDALRILREATSPALSLQECVDILTGKANLAREEKGYRLVAQDPKCPALARYLKTAAWQQAGVLDIDGEFYQPYARVTSFGVEDEEAVLSLYRSRDGDWVSAEKYRELRAKYYARHPDSDIVRFDVLPEPVLFRRVQGPAFWVPTFREADEALTAYLELRDLEDFGHPRASRTGKPLLPDSFEFYFQGTREGYLSGHDDLELEGEEGKHLEALVQLREAYDNRRYELSCGEETFDERGVLMQDRLADDYEMDSLCLLYRPRVLAQAEVQGGFMSLTVGEGSGAHELRVPRTPFLKWATHGNQKTYGTMHLWKPVCPTGIKMMGDDPVHSDWFIGAGLSPRLAYDVEHPVNKAAWRFRSNLAYSEGRQCVRLAGRGRVTGAVVFPKSGEGVPEGTIAVVPNAGVDYALALMSACRTGAGAVIAAVGGKLAHLATVSREMGARLVVVDDALSRFAEGDVVTIDLEEGTVAILGRNSPFEDKA